MKQNYGFIADLFDHQYKGGAELTTRALIESCPSPADAWMANCNQITRQNLEDLYREDKIKNRKTKLIFGNFMSLDGSQMPVIMKNFDYYVIEYDYKFCQYRSPEKHEASEGDPCNCETRIQGQVIEQFYKMAQHVFFMSEKQRQVYAQRFPQWDMLNTTVLSSVFSKDEWKIIEDAKTLQKGVIRNKFWTFQQSDSWIKGSIDSEDKAKEISDNRVIAIENLEKMELLNLFSGCAGFVFLPKGSDTCPRIVIEAKLMDCPTVMNNNVQHVSEPWFAHGTYESMKEYLQGRPAVFWNLVSGK